MKHLKPEDLETDERFPSGPWIGFFVDKRMPGKHQMELELAFSKGDIHGEGRDRVGEFIIAGKYFIADGKAHFSKRYLQAHDVFYKGYNEGKGIWGLWELTDMGETFNGGFHIWPKGMKDPTLPVKEEEADIPLEAEEAPPYEDEEVEEGELVPLGAGGREFDYSRRDR